MFSCGIRICTDTGIEAALFKVQTGPIIATHSEPRQAGSSFGRTGPTQEKTFSASVVGLIRKHIEAEWVSLWDSKQRIGRPSITELLKDVWKS